MKRALVVQSNEETAKLVTDAIGDMFAIEFVSDFAKANELAEDSFFDILICAVSNATFKDATTLVSFLKKLDHYVNSQVFILSNEKCMLQLSSAFEAGCDEYLSLPIEPLELKVRVRARLKDSLPAIKTDFHWAAELRFCAGTLRVVATDDTSTEDLDLTPNEFRILFLLSRNLNKALSRDFILTEVWGKKMHVVARTVDKHICSLRRKLGRRSGYLVSVPNKGYMFQVQSKSQKPPVISSQALNSAS